MNGHLKIAKDDAAYRDTAAAKLLSQGLIMAATERGLSQRAIAKLLGYKQSVVLSHMALGRVPIPLDRAQQLAEILLLSPETFTLAVLQQRHPSVRWVEMFGTTEARRRDGKLVRDIEAILDTTIDHLSDEQTLVMREVAADRNAANRWLSVHEIPVIALLRTIRPRMCVDGISSEDVEALRKALSEHGDTGPS
ncbi:hypothetical protein GCM10009106_02500 [Sphingomonas japonica]